MMIEDEAGSDWELSLCTILSATSFSRETVLNGSSGSGVKVNFGAGTKSVFATVAGEQISMVSDAPFSAAIPLTRPGSSYMAAKTVTGPLTFTAAAGAVRGALVYLRLTADGVNLPNLSAFKEWGGSSGYDNRQGIVNQLQFFYDGSDLFYTASQAVGATPIDSTAPVLTSVSGSATGPTTANGSVTTNEGDGTLFFLFSTSSVATAAVVKAAGSQAITSSGTKNVAATGLTAAATYYVHFLHRDAAGNDSNVVSSSGFTTPAASASESMARFTSLAAMTETGTGPYNYAGTGSSSTFVNNVGGVSTQSLPASTDGSLSCVLGTYDTAGGVPANEVILGLKTGSARVAWQSLLCALFARSTEAMYAPMTSGTIGTPTAVLAPANGDIIRIRRAGSAVIGEVARAASPTVFTTVYTWSGVTTGAIYFQGACSKLAQLNSPVGVGLV
jgi:hypothetical protein